MISACKTVDGGTTFPKCSGQFNSDINIAELFHILFVLFFLLFGETAFPPQIVETSARLLRLTANKQHNLWIYAY